MGRNSGIGSRVIGVRVELALEQHLRLLTEVTGRSQSFFLKQMIESSIEAMEKRWVPDHVMVQVREGGLSVQQPGATPDLFGDLLCDQ